MNERIWNMKARYLRTKPNITPERLLLATEAYGKYAGEAIPVFRAHVTAHVMDNMKLAINEGELIVGMPSCTYRGANLFPEYTSTKWLVPELDVFATRKKDRIDITEEDKKIIRDCLEGFWKGRAIEDLGDEVLPERTRRAVSTDVITLGLRTGCSGETVPDYGILMDKGLEGLIADCRAQIENAPRESKEDQQKVDFWEACIIVCEAIIRFARRFADLAEFEAAAERDPARAEELKRIAAVCRNVPEHSPRGFHEALQFVWFIHLAFHIEAPTTACSFGRFDQVLYPYLKKDYDAGVLDHDSALELLECFFVKTGEPIEVRDSWYSEAFAGYPMWCIVMVGGMDTDGNDASNDLTYMCLEASSELQMSEPVLAVRIHEGTPKKLFREGARMIQAGMANPGFFNDDVAMEIVRRKGATEEEARNWVIVGCTQPQPGGGAADGAPDAGYVNTAKMMELVLHNGVDPATGEQIGLATGDPTQFKSMDEVREACEKQIMYFYEMIREGYDIMEINHMTRLPVIFASAVMGGCIESGKSVQEGGTKYTSAGMFITGPSNLVDSLVAIDEIVFKDKAVTMKELIEALDNNFEGQERLRQLLLTKPPKFGNDDPVADGLAEEILESISSRVQEMHDARGGVYDFTMMSQTVNVPHGRVVGATPDGRRAGDPLNDNSSPMMGRDISGPTATVKSVAHWGQVNFADGALFNLRFDPRGVRGEKGLEIIEGVIKTYFEHGGQHIQINVVDDATLRAAQKKPEDYRGLVVRVAGYMAYFTELDREVQEAIIDRTAHLA
jgi:formate C-acetyltransferase